MARAQTRLSWMPWAIGLGACLGTGPLHAQSSYSMTTLGLGPAYQNQPNPPRSAWIDSQDRVWSTMNYYEGKKLVTVWDPFRSGFPLKFEWRDTFTNYAVRHAGSGTTLAAAKLTSKNSWLQVVSPNGQRAYVLSSTGVTAVASSPALNVEAGTWVTAMLDSGAYTGRITRTDSSLPVEVAQFDSPALWVPGQARQDLPVPNGYVDGVGLALNTRNEVAGAVFTLYQMVPQAAVWRQGQLTVLDASADQASFATGISELGHVLVMRYPYKVQVTDPAIPNYNVTEGLPSHTVFYNGQRLNLACPDALLPRAQAAAISPNGLVVGQCAPPTETRTSSSSGIPFNQPLVPDLVTYHGKAWIWRDGVDNELASYLTARGVKLPAGMTLRHVMAVNAKGSMVVLTVNASGQSGLARFTALN